MYEHMCRTNATNLLVLEPVRDQVIRYDLSSEYMRADVRANAGVSSKERCESRNGRAMRHPRHVGPYRHCMDKTHSAHVAQFAPGASRHECDELASTLR